jgi:hypothetical protein
VYACAPDAFTIGKGDVARECSSSACDVNYSHRCLRARRGSGRMPVKHDAVADPDGACPPSFRSYRTRPDRIPPDRLPLIARLPNTADRAVAPFADPL